jgi:chromosome segregation ATPase
MEQAYEKYTQNENRTNTDSGKSSKSVRKKSEISSGTIINSIEREISELIAEISIRSQKNKLLSIGEYLKLLYKRLPIETKESSSFFRQDSSVNSILHKTSSNEENKLKEEIKTLKSNYEIEIKKLKEEIAELKNLHKIKEKESSSTLSNINITNANLIQSNKKLEEATLLLSEERQTNKTLNLQVKGLEEALKVLNSEYNSLSFKYGKIQSDCEFLEKTLNEMKRHNHEYKEKFEELVKINTDLKSKISDYDTNYRLHNDDVKSLLKKISSQQKTIEDLDVKNRQSSAELAYKEERLKAIRLMNNRLEQKSQQILKKFEAFRLFEEKSNELSANSQKMYEIIEDLNSRLTQEAEEKDIQRKISEKLGNQITKLSAEHDEVKKQLLSLKLLNEELLNKNSELESKFKRSLDYRPGDSKDNSVIKGKNFFSNAMTNLNQVC